ncbi:MAG: S53 family peptidase [Candidatus Acidiferrales bacterium]
MASRSSHVPIVGSEYPAVGASVIAPSDPREQIKITIVVRPRRPAPELHADRELAGRLPRDRRHLSREEFESNHGAHADDLAQVEKFAREHGFEIVETSSARHSVVLQGSAGDFSKAFRVEMIQYEHERGRHRGFSGPIYIPRELADSVQAVLGLHDRPCVRRHMPATGVKKARRASFSPQDIAELYRFPRHANGNGQCIGVIELGGGYYKSDLESFFSASKLPVPRITDVSVDGAKNAPADRASLTKFMTALTSGKNFAKNGNSESRRAMDLAMSTTETTMDIELVAAFAPGAHIVVYFAPNTEQGIYHALTTALADKKHRPSVLSLSWGEPEPNVSPKYATLINEVLKNLANVGVTVCVSSGDSGAHNGTPGKPSVNFPASSPYALGCGGTTMKVSGSKIEAETVWNCVFDGMHGATGGGVSRMFPRPYWQQDFAVPHSSSKDGGRGVPDVAAVADPHTGCRIVVGGVDGVSAGTSAVAPLWAALVARLNHAMDAHSGYLNSLLYKLAARPSEGGTFRPITHGENGAYHAGPGWNACTGLGSPLGDRLLEALEGAVK